LVGKWPGIPGRSLPRQASGGAHAGRAHPGAGFPKQGGDFRFILGEGEALLGNKVEKEVKNNVPGTREGVLCLHGGAEKRPEDGGSGGRRKKKILCGRGPTSS